MSSWIIHFDGLCEPYNPGGVAAYGWTLHDAENRLIESGYGIAGSGNGMTNNVSEFSALEAALKAIPKCVLGKPRLKIKGDSKLVIYSLNGEWQLRKPHLIVLRNRIRGLLKEVSTKWEMEWISREQNEEADALSRLAYEEHTGKKLVKTLAERYKKVK